MINVEGLNAEQGSVFSACLLRMVVHLFETASMLTVTQLILF